MSTVPLSAASSKSAAVAVPAIVQYNVEFGKLDVVTVKFTVSPSSTTSLSGLIEYPGTGVVEVSSTLTSAAAANRVAFAKFPLLLSYNLSLI